jgi:hypothetical protein
MATVCKSPAAIFGVTAAEAFPKETKKNAKTTMDHVPMTLNLFSMSRLSSLFTSYVSIKKLLLLKKQNSKSSSTHIPPLS